MVESRFSRVTFHRVRMPIPVMLGNWASVFLANFPRRTGKGDYVVVSCSSTDRPNWIAGDACPGLFYQTPAQDGFLVRIRVPGGSLSAAQAKYLAAIAQDYGGGQVWLTNRANVQLRLNQAVMPDRVFGQLQELGLAARNAMVDHLRNIMASPTAGIDGSAMIDVQPLVRSVDEYLSNQPELAPLSAKFSIGFDAGEAISIRHRRNDVWFVAAAVDRLQLFFGETDTGMVVAPDQVVAVVAAISQLYLAVCLEAAPQIWAAGVQQKSHKPRWQQVVAVVGLDEICQWVRSRTAVQTAPRLPMPGKPERLMAPIGVHAQGDRSQYGKKQTQKPQQLEFGAQPEHEHQIGLYYIGIVVPLGKLQSQQLQDLAELAETYGNGELRITPWQNIVIPSVQSPTQLQMRLQQLGYSIDPHHPAAGLVACTGLPGCASSFTVTQADALRISESFIGKLDRPTNIHVSGCAKGCAQPYGSDIALMGMESGNYDLYGRSGNQVFGQLLQQNIRPNDLPKAIQTALQEVLPC